MGGHRHLVIHDAGPLHRVAPEAKIVATLAFAFAVIATPAGRWWAFACYAALVLATTLIARVPMGHLARRLTIELPFVAFAVFLPIVGRGPRVDVLWFRLSQPGLLAAWNIVAKGTLGVAAAVVLAATTPIPQLLTGLERLRVPNRLVAIAAFMLRYGDVLGQEIERMRIARMSRGYDPRWLFQARAIASSLGTLFVRSYERGERVYLAMESRGYTGSMPARVGTATTRMWAAALVAPTLAVVISVMAVVL
jgi:cobalt/nickel transport system permease protein